MLLCKIPLWPEQGSLSGSGMSIVLPSEDQSLSTHHPYTSQVFVVLKWSRLAGADPAFAICAGNAEAGNAKDTHPPKDPFSGSRSSDNQPNVLDICPAPAGPGCTWTSELPGGFQGARLLQTWTCSWSSD